MDHSEDTQHLRALWLDLVDATPPDALFRSLAFLHDVDVMAKAIAIVGANNHLFTDDAYGGSTHERRIRYFRGAIRQLERGRP